MTAVRPGTGDGYRVITDQGVWQAPTVMLASGGCNARPCAGCGGRGARTVDDDHADRRTADPASCPTGGVLVVGASASGIQIADEIHRSGGR